MEIEYLDNKILWKNKTVYLDGIILKSEWIKNIYCFCSPLKASPHVVLLCAYFDWIHGIDFGTNLRFGTKDTDLDFLFVLSWSSLYFISFKQESNFGFPTITL